MTDEIFVNVMFPDEYKDFIAELCYKGECFCIVTQEDGPGNFSIEFWDVSNRVPYEPFLEALQRGTQRLVELRKIED